MEYLKAFTIGTSGIVSFSLFSSIIYDEKYEYHNIFSFIIPIYYGIMCMISLYIGNKLGLSLQSRLLIISLVSITIIILGNHLLINKYQQENDKDKNNDFLFIIQDSIRQLIVFNIIIYYFTTNFSKSRLLKNFVIGSSIFSYIFAYLKVYWKDYKNINNYDYKYFTLTEPFVQGIGLTIGLYILHIKMKINLIKSLILYQIISSIVMAVIGYIKKMYKFNDIEWITNYLRGLLISGCIKTIPIYYLIQNLK